MVVEDIHFDVRFLGATPEFMQANGTMTSRLDVDCLAWEKDQMMEFLRLAQTVGVVRITIDGEKVAALPKDKLPPAMRRKLEQKERMDADPDVGAW